MRLWVIALILLPAAVAVAGDVEKFPNNYAPPAISVQQAIKKAQHCLAEKKIAVGKDYFLTSVRFEEAREKAMDGKEHGRPWHLLWTMTPPTPGGHFMVTIYEDGFCFHMAGL